MSEAGPLASFSFHTCVGTFIELPTEVAREILPGDLQPVELHHGASVLSAMVFDYRETPFGDYRELVMGVAVAPFVDGGAPMPRSAFFPFVLGSTSAPAREFAAAQLHLPYLDRDMEIELTGEAGAVDVIVADAGTTVLEMRVTEYDWREVDHAYQSLMHNDTGLWAADIRMVATFSENEEQRGSLVLHPHALTAPVPVDEVDDAPFREQWMRSGTQIIQQLRRVTGPTR